MTQSRSFNIEPWAHDIVLFHFFYRNHCGPRISIARCVSHSMANSIFIWKKNDFYWLFENDLELPLIFVLFLKGKQNKKEKP